MNEEMIECFREFVKGKTSVSLVRRTGGRKSSKNMAILGENLATLAALKAGFGTAQDSFKVDVIAIDPPYNVGGNQGYKNIWKGQSEHERNWASDHGAFLDFMEPRLKIGRQLLTDEGVIFINICDGEYCRLKILMDQIFGEENCLGTIIWDKNQGSYGKHLTVIHEYILVYAKDATKAPRLTKAKGGAEILLSKAKQLRENKVPYPEAQKEFSRYIKQLKATKQITGGEAMYSFLHPNTFKPFRLTSMSAQDNPEKRYNKPLIHPVTGKKCQVPGKGWKWKEETLLSKANYKKADLIITEKYVIAGEVCYGKDESTIPNQVWYLENSMDHAMPTVINIPHNQGKRDLPEGLEFATPKPIALLKELIKTYPKNDCRVMDYFGGSGTTAHAVHELNTEDGGSRSWILIEEMGSTYHKVLIPRIKYIDKKEDFATYEIDSIEVGGKALLKKFSEYSNDFLTSCHVLDETEAAFVQGLKKFLI